MTVLDSQRLEDYSTRATARRQGPCEIPFFEAFFAKPFSSPLLFDRPCYRSTYFDDLKAAGFSTDETRENKRNNTQFL